MLRQCLVHAGTVEKMKFLKPGTLLSLCYHFRTGTVWWPSPYVSHIAYICDNRINPSFMRWSQKHQDRIYLRFQKSIAKTDEFMRSSSNTTCNIILDKWVKALPVQHLSILTSALFFCILFHRNLLHQIPNDNRLDSKNSRQGNNVKQYGINTSKCKRKWLERLETYVIRVVNWLAYRKFWIH